jgi:peroxiredoxin (alkyl hydroperoxide reductase subunit C)
MKKITIFIILFSLTTTLTWSQGKIKIPLIGEPAPKFTAESTNGKITFPDDFGKNWKILFSHPRDFTPVCSSELLELANMQSDFDQLGVKLVVVSTDSLANHRLWKKSLESLSYQGIQPQKIMFPLVSDESLKVSRKYGMLHTPVSTVKDVRGVFIIDPDNIVQVVYFYPMEIGRNMEEIKRTVIALQTIHNNVVLPANWEPGDDVILSYLTKEEQASMEQQDGNIYQVAWYLTFMKAK